VTALDRLALVAVLAWAAGALASRYVGPWAGLGGTAVVVGIAAAWRAPAVVWPGSRCSGRTGAWAATGLAAGVVLVAGTEAVFAADRAGPAWLAGDVAALYARLRAVEPAWIALAALPAVVVAEEVVWRGVVFAALARRMGAPVAVALATAAFAAVHVPAGSAALVVAALGCGLVWTALRAVTRSLVPAAVCHLVWDASVLLVRPLA
jgi:membrane protease YdiL (CAAX protease family)